MTLMTRLLVFGLGAAVAFASPVTITYTGTASGFWGTTYFNNSAFTITSYAANDDVTENTTILGVHDYDLTATTTTITVGGHTATLTDPTYWQTDTVGSTGTLGLYQVATILGINTNELLMGGTSPNLAGYELTTSLSSSLSFSAGLDLSIPTSYRSLRIMTVSTSNSFSAAVTPDPPAPEPASPWLGGSGLAGLILLGFHRRTRRTA